MWLARRLAELSSLHPETPLHAVVVDDEPDFARSGVDLAIVHVLAPRLRDDDDVLMRETVFSVCSPELYPHASGYVCRSRLLQKMHEDSPEIDWRNGAVQFGLPDDFETKIVRYSSFSQAIGAALGRACRRSSPNCAAAAWCRWCRASHAMRHGASCFAAIRRHGFGCSIR
ncbi:hypothetical protein [Burkholderia sp. AW49-1]